MVRKRSFRTNVTPTPTTGARLTHVRNPRAGARFTPGDHVRWCDEEAIFISEDPRDPTIAIVRLIADGHVTEWPGALAGMRRMQTANYDTPPSLDPMGLPIAGELTNVFRQPIVEPPALPVPIDDDDEYENIELTNQQHTQRVNRFEDTIADLGDTLTDLERRKKR
jgi:hypothetical protein